MRKLLIILGILGLVVPVSVGHIRAQTSLVKDNLLSMEQQVKIADLITKETAPLTNVNFPVAIDGTVPPEIQLRALPPDAEKIAPRFRGFGYVVVEEQIAIIDQHTRKIALVIPRGRQQSN